jgi:Ca2+-binding EF-hand superfamily protein
MLLGGCSQTAEKTPAQKQASPGYSTVYDAFSRHDTNGNGFIDEHEFHQFQNDPQIVNVRKRIPKVNSSIPLLFNEIDEDGDGKISMDEMTIIVEGLKP